MTILAIETSGAGGSVALAAGGTLHERQVGETRDQTSRVLPLIDEVLGAAALTVDELDAIAFGRGPGSFTGLRVAAAVAQGLGLATGVPLIAVSSLAGLAQQAKRRFDAAAVLVVIDARMREVCHGQFVISSGLAVAAAEEAIGLPTDVAQPVPPYICVGDGFAAYPDVLAGVAADAIAVVDDCVPCARDLLPLAVDLLERGECVAPADALPVYLRDSTAWQRS